MHLFIWVVVFMEKNGRSTRQKQRVMKKVTGVLRSCHQKYYAHSSIRSISWMIYILLIMYQVQEAEARRKAERAAKFEEGRRLKQARNWYWFGQTSILEPLFGDIFVQPESVEPYSPSAGVLRWAEVFHQTPNTQAVLVELLCLVRTFVPLILIRGPLLIPFQAGSKDGSLMLISIFGHTDS